MTQWLFCFCFFFESNVPCCARSPHAFASHPGVVVTHAPIRIVIWDFHQFFFPALSHTPTHARRIFCAGFSMDDVLMNFASSAHKVYRVISGSPHQRRAAPIVANVATLGGVGGVGHLFYETPLSRRPFKRPEQTNSARRV